MEYPICNSWLGKTWIQNLFRFAYDIKRMDRGRNYCKQGAVIHLSINANRVSAQVRGSYYETYDVNIRVDPLTAYGQSKLTEALQNRIEVLTELQQGRIPQSLKGILNNQSFGLFPSPSDIFFNCNCPDWAGMCKHVVASLLSLGIRFDEAPKLLFDLRGLDLDEMVDSAINREVQQLLDKAERGSGNCIDESKLAAVFKI